MRIYEKHPYADAYRIGRAYVPYASIAADKRFTDAELAAEYWFQMWGLLPFIKNGKANTRGKTDRQRILSRFATLPHYDEDPQ